MENLGRTFGVLLVLGFFAAPAAAEHPEAADASLEALAHRLERSTRQLHRRAERQADHRGRRQRRALRALHDLEESAAHFHSRVEHSRPDSGRRLDDFRTLKRRFEKAHERFHRLHPPERLYADLARVEELVDALEARLACGHRSRHAGWSEHRDAPRRHRRGWVSWGHDERQPPFFGFAWASTR